MRKVIVEVPGPEDKRKKSWRKRLDHVDTSRSNGYAFVGEFLRPGERAEVLEGDFILAFDQPGSMKNWWPYVRVYRATGSELREVYRYEGEKGERNWALGCRDAIAVIMEGSEEVTEDSEIRDYTDQQILDEARRRGLL